MLQFVRSDRRRRSRAQVDPRHRRLEQGAGRGGRVGELREDIVTACRSSDRDARCAARRMPLLISTSREAQPQTTRRPPRSAKSDGPSGSATAGQRPRAREPSRAPRHPLRRGTHRGRSPAEHRSFISEKKIPAPDGGEEGSTSTRRSKNREPAIEKRCAAPRATNGGCGSSA